MSDELDKLRKRIDEIDIKIQEVINERAGLAGKVAQAKRAKEPHPNFYRPEREAEVLRNVIARNQAGPLRNETLVLLFREIMSACLALQEPLKVAFLGPEGTYSQDALFKHFGHSVTALSSFTIAEVFREVEIGRAHYGIVPIENSTEGGINQTLDYLVETQLKLCGEVKLPIHHHLLSLSNRLDEITLVYSHQQSLAQCRAWLDTHLPKVERMAVKSNAEAARRAAREPGAAAIASQTAATIYELKIIEQRIEDNVSNTTRFVVIGPPQRILPTGKDKTSLLLYAANKPGDLYRSLKVFADNQINLTRIESRPSRQEIWEYVFFIDIEGHIEDEHVANTIKILEKQTSLIKHLGSYPNAIVEI